MTPKFLLNLSKGNISLEQRSTGGAWLFLGYVRPDEANLADALTKLRALVQPDITNSIEVIIVVPTDQIKTISLEKKHITKLDVVATLEGQTPYDTSELCIDWTNYKAGSTIAAVTRGTLKDLASFAQKFNFSAMMFVALPGGSWQNNFAIFDPTQLPTSRISARLPPYVTVSKKKNVQGLDLIPPSKPSQKLDKVMLTPETQAYSIQNSLAKPIRVPITHRVLSPVAKATEAIRISASASSSSVGAAKSIHSGGPIIATALRSNTNTKIRDISKLVTSSTQLQSRFSSKKNKFFNLIFEIIKNRNAKKNKAIPRKKSIRALQAEVGGKPRYLGIILTTLLLTWMLTCAAWAAIDGLDHHALPTKLVLKTNILAELLIIAPALEAGAIPVKKSKLIQATHILSKNYNITFKNHPRARPAYFKMRLKPVSSSGLSYYNLATFRPVSRLTLGQNIKYSSVKLELATATSLKPRIRPNWIKIAPLAPAPNIVSLKKVQAPTVTSQQSVIYAATVKNILNLRNISLIGVSGAKNNPNAIVRLTNGKVLKVKIGDRLNGGRVTDIDTTTLTYAKFSRSFVIKMPRD